eukprot:scaffold58954_cov53-Phaeocystis_antarctica.AAC.3
MATKATLAVLGSAAYVVGVSSLPSWMRHQKPLPLSASTTMTESLARPERDGPARPRGTVWGVL